MAEIIILVLIVIWFFAAMYFVIPTEKNLANRIPYEEPVDTGYESYMKSFDRW